MADTVIDKVQIEIEATAKGATAVFAKLEAELTKLQNAMNKIDTSKLNAVAKATKAIKIDTSGMTKAEQDVSNSVDKIKQSLAGLNAYKVAALGGDKSSLVSFERNVIKIQSSIDILREKLNQLGTVHVPTTAFEQLGEKEKALEDKMSNLKAQMDAVLSGKVVMSNNEFDNLKESIINTQVELSKLSNEQAELINSGQAYYDPYAAYRDSADMLQSSLSAAKAEVQAMQNAMQNTNQTPKTDKWADLKKWLSDAADEAKRLAKSLGEIGSKALNAGISALKSGLSRLKDAITSAGSSTGSLKHGFMTVLKYGFGIRSLYVLFRRLRKAVIESFGELQNSGAFYETTRANIEALKASLTTLKFQFGAAFEPIFNAIAPALKTLIDYLITAANAISAFMAKLTGKSTYSKAVVSMGSLAKNTGSAAKAQKELNKQLQSFDELNNLTTNNGGGGGGGAGGGGSTPDATYVEESVDNALGDWGKRLAEMIRNGDWHDVGKAISDKLVEAMKSIPWEKVFKWAEDFGKNLADFLNGLINPELFGEIGKTLANALNAAFSGLHSFAEEFDWTNLGTSIGTAITEWFKTADFALYGDTIHDFIGGILDAGIALIDNTDFSEIGTKIADFITNLDIPDLASKFSTLAQKIASGIGEALTSMNESSPGMGDLIAGIGAIIAVAAATGSVPVTLSVTAAIAGFYIGDKLYEWGSGNTTDQSFAEGISDIINGLFGDDKVEIDLGELITFTFKDITGGNSNMSLSERYFKGGVMSWLVGGGTLTTITTVWQLKSKLLGALTKLADYLKLDEIWSSIKKAWSDLTTNIKGTLTGAFQKIDDVLDLKTKWEALKDVWKDITTNVKASFGGALTRATDLDTWKTKYTNLTSVWNDISATASAYVGGQISKITDLNTWKTDFTNLANVWKDKTATFTANLAGTLKNITDLDTWKQKASDLRSAWESKSATFTANLGTTLDTLNNWKSKIDNLRTSWSDKSAKFTASFPDTLNHWVDKMAELVHMWQDKTATFKLDFSTSVSNVKDWVNNHVITPLNNAIHGVSILKNVNIPQLKAKGGVATKATNVIYGEAGAEAIVPLENNLGWLQKMSNMMLDGMENASRYRFTATPPSVEISENSAISAASANNELLIEQNRLISEQNRLLQIIAEKNVTISSKEVFSAVSSESRNYYTRTGNNPLLY